jgi:rhodanese-related sulfurtransferase
MDYDLDEMKEAVESGRAQLLDVREEEEWEMGHLEVANFVPLSSLNEGECPEGLDKTMTTYIHCRSGKRVLQAAPLLTKMGFKKIIPLEEGFEALLGEGFRMGHD